MAQKLKQSYSRKSVRFKPEATTLAEAQIHTDRGLTPPAPGIIRDESFRGCSAIFQKASGIALNALGLIKVGTLEPLKFRVVWVSEMKNDFVKCGIEYLE